MRYDGYTGTILVEGTDLVWLRRGVTAKMNRLPAERRVPLADVRGVVLKPATRLVNGRLTVLLRGEIPPTLNAGTAAAHPGTVLFRFRDNDMFARLHQWLLHVADVNAANPSTAAAPSTTGESGDAGAARTGPHRVGPGGTGSGGSVASSPRVFDFAAPQPVDPSAERPIDPPAIARGDVFPEDPAVGLVWAAPPGWPSVPPGWWPEATWMPTSDPAAGSGTDPEGSRTDFKDHLVPSNYQCWRVVNPPEAVSAATVEPPGLPAEYQESGFPTAAERRRWEVSTFRGRVEMVNDLEALLARAREWRTEWAVEDDEYSALGVRLPADHHTKKARLEAWTSLVTMVVAARDWLLHALASDTAPGAEYFAWIDQFPDRSDTYWAADRAVSEALGHQRDRVLATMTPEQRHRYWFGEGPAPGSTEEWQAAERLAERVLHQIGFENATRTPAGADKGLDVASDVVAAQVKYTSTPVGRPVLQQLQGAAGGRITVFFSRAGYSTAAVEYATEVGMALFHITLPVRVRAVNGAAERMVRAEEQPPTL